MEVALWLISMYDYVHVFYIHMHLNYNTLSYVKCNYWEYSSRHTSEGMENNQSSPSFKLELSVTSFIGSICCKSESIQTRGFIVYHALYIQFVMFLII